MTHATPGPWKLSAAGDLVLRRDYPHQQIAYTSAADVDDQTLVANGIVLAAAPDLYDALDRLVYLVELARREGRIDGTEADLVALGTAIREASTLLARVRGEP